LIYLSDFKLTTNGTGVTACETTHTHVVMVKDKRLTGISAMGYRHIATIAEIRYQALYFSYQFLL